MDTSTTDRIEKKALLHAPRKRVWRALTDAEEFGNWFGVKLEGSFAVGKSIKGRITSPGYEHLTMEIIVERMDAEHLFSYRWHPYAMDLNVDYSTEPTTLVEFRLEEVADGTMLTLIESGFDQIPLERRDEAFRMNTEGWGVQMEAIEEYVSTTA